MCRRGQRREEKTEGQRRELSRSCRPKTQTAQAQTQDVRTYVDGKREMRSHGLQWRWNAWLCRAARRESGSDICRGAWDEQSGSTKTYVRMCVPACVHTCVRGSRRHQPQRHAEQTSRHPSVRYLSIKGPSPEWRQPGTARAHQHSPCQRQESPNKCKRLSTRTHRGSASRAQASASACPPAPTVRSLFLRPTAKW